VFGERGERRRGRRKDELRGFKKLVYNPLSRLTGWPRGESLDQFPEGELLVCWDRKVRIEQGQTRQKEKRIYVPLIVLGTMVVSHNNRC
jgi:hypothetical protein